MIVENYCIILQIFKMSDVRINKEIAMVRKDVFGNAGETQFFIEESAMAHLNIARQRLAHQLIAHSKCCYFSA